MPESGHKDVGRLESRRRGQGGLELAQRVVGSDAMLQVDMVGEKRLLLVRIKCTHHSARLDINSIFLFNE